LCDLDQAGKVRIHNSCEFDSAIASTVAWGQCSGVTPEPDYVLP
jgi:hypothetical protein